MQNEKIKFLYDKLRLKYNPKKDSKNIQILWRIERSLHLLYPYEFIHDSKGVPNYNLKSIIFDTYSHELDVVRKYKRAEYIEQRYIAERPLRDNSDSYIYGFDLLKPEDMALARQRLSEGEKVKEQSRLLFYECERIVNAEHARRKRLRQRVQRLMDSGQTFFVTLTFNDETLNNTDVLTRRRYVTRLLKEVSNDYVGNIDFGKLNGREHYHAVISSDKLSDIKYTYSKRYGYMCTDTPVFSDWSRLGYYSIKSCGTSDTDKLKLASYTSKLVNHAIKETTKRNALLYSR